MKKLTEEQANAVLAEKVMGWENRAGMYFDTVDDTIVKCTYVHNWNPATNPEHALQCLKAWKANSVDHTYLIDSGRGNDDPRVFLSVKYREFDPYKYDYMGYDPDLCTAICNAILQAIGAGQLGETK